MFQVCEATGEDVQDTLRYTRCHPRLNEPGGYRTASLTSLRLPQPLPTLNEKPGCATYHPRWAPGEVGVQQSSARFRLPYSVGWAVTGTLDN